VSQVAQPLPLLKKQFFYPKLLDLAGLTLTRLDEPNGFSIHSPLTATMALASLVSGKNKQSFISGNYLNLPKLG
jgi:hypothetical protein